MAPHPGEVRWYAGHGVGDDLVEGSTIPLPDEWYTFEQRDT